MATFAITDNLDWTVSHRALSFVGNDGQQVPIADKVAVVRNDNGAFLGTVSSNYETVQNSNMLKLINPLVEEGLLEISNMGHLNGGARVFCQAKVNQEFQVIGEDYNNYITVLNGHSGNCALGIGATMTRVICGNTFSSAYKDIGEKYRHSEGVNSRVLESSFVVDYVNGAMKTYSNYMEKIASERCSGIQFRNFLETVYQKEVKDMRPSFVEQLNDLFYNGKGNSGQTYHDAFAACTEYASNYSRKTESGRFLYSQFGQGARINNRALSVAMEMVAA